MSPTAIRVLSALRRDLRTGYRSYSRSYHNTPVYVLHSNRPLRRWLVSGVN